MFTIVNAEYYPQGRGQLCILFEQCGSSIACSRKSPEVVDSGGKMICK